MFLSVQEIAKKWDISDRRVRALCEKGQIEGAVKVGKVWNIPEDAKKPKDSRKNRDVFNEIETKKVELDSLRPLTQGELERLNILIIQMQLKETLLLLGKQIWFLGV